MAAGPEATPSDPTPSPHSTASHPSSDPAAAAQPTACPVPASEPSAPASSAAVVLDKLAAMDMARKVEREKRREDARALSDPRESISQFLSSFAAQHSEAERALQQLQARQQQQSGATATAAPTGSQAVAPEDMQAHLDELAAQALTLEQSAAAASYYLPSYDQKQCANAVAALRASIEAVRAALVPRKRFSFASKKVNKVKGEDVSGGAATDAAAAAAAAAPSGASPTAGAEGAPGASSSGSSSIVVGERDMALVRAGRGLMGLRDAVVVRRVSDAAGQDFVLADLERCTVFVLGQLPALRLLGLRACRVYAGPVTGATFVDDVRDSLLALASYQVRVHRTHASQLALRVRSNPIIEHSTGVRVAPLEAALRADEPRLAALLRAHRLEEETGTWQQVDDFGWIKSVQSPNWSILPREEWPVQPAEVPEEAWAAQPPAGAAAGGQAEDEI